MPPETYDAYLDTAWKPQITPQFSADLAIRVGVYSDFNFVNYQSLRTPARRLGLYAINPQLTIVAGVVYLDRLSVRLLPAGGVVWTPDPDTRLELFFPRPKLSRRMGPIRGGNAWWFVEGEYGGNTWTIRRSGRLGGRGGLQRFAGEHRQRMDQLRRRRRINFEAGYVFNRRLMYRSGYTPTAYPHGTYMLRSGISF